MKLSIIPTNYLIVRASTQSEWDNVSFALIELTDTFLSDLKAQVEFAQSSPPDCLHVAFSGYDAEYYDGATNDDIEGEVDDIIATLDANEYSFIEVTEAEIEKLRKPESSLDAHELLINAARESVYIKFTCLGKHTSEQFWTASIDSNFLLNPKVKNNGN